MAKMGKGCIAALVVMVTLLCLVIAFIIAAWYVYVYALTPVVIHNEGDVVKVDIQYLGEYPSGVRAIKVYQKADNKVLAHVVSANPRGMSDIHWFHVHVGENDPIPDDLKSSFVSMIPGSPTYILERNVDYCVVVYGENTNSMDCFRFDSFVQSDE